MKPTTLALPALLGLVVTAAVFLAEAPPSAQASPGGVTFTGAMGHRVFAAADNGVVATTPAGPGNVVDLAQAGLYDVGTYGWAVVFDYASITVEAGAIVQFLNHPSGAPVIWHATGDVSVAGELWLGGADGGDNASGAAYAEPGPGGFRGGRAGYLVAGEGSAGLGPGGGFLDQIAGTNWYEVGGSASHATLGHAEAQQGYSASTYGGANLFPLVGGSGGAGGRSWTGLSAGGGGGGGGAILLAAAGQLVLEGTARVYCNGGAGGLGSWGPHLHGGSGSGGAIRLVGDSVLVQPDAVLETISYPSSSAWGPGGVGRIRIEANALTDPNKLQVLTNLIAGDYSESSEVHEIIAQAEPTLRVVAFSEDGLPGTNWTDISLETADPRARLSPPSSADVELPSTGTVGLRIRATGIAAGEQVRLRLTHTRDQAVEVLTGPLVATGNADEAEVDVEVTLQPGVSAIQLRVDLND